MVATSRDHILTIFKEFSTTLDDHNDRKERLVKIARDITVLSKRIIFLLHRIPIPGHDHDPNGVGERGIPNIGGAGEAYVKLEGMKKLLQAMSEQLQGQQVERYSAMMSEVL
jgi:predicted translin family RNA/ssDNA-binding protein